VGEGLATTFEWLSRTDNEAAVPVLIAALDHASQTIQEGALVALLNRRPPAGGREILDRMSQLKPEWKAIVQQHEGRLTGALRDAIQGTDARRCAAACSLAVSFREYDLIPTLLASLTAAPRPAADLAPKTVLEIVEALYDELAAARTPGQRRDPQQTRRYAVSSLEEWVQRFGQHRRREVVEAFLLLVGRDNATLKQVLQSPHHAACQVLLDTLARSPQRGVIRLLLSFLEDLHAPAAALSVLARRSDAKFVHYLLRKVGREPSAAVAGNLKRIDSFAWLGGPAKLLDQLDDADQHAVVRLLMASGVPRQQAMLTIEHLLSYGKPGGRREAARALAEFHGSEANALAMRVLRDPDPQVQANLVPQLRGRGIPGTLAVLLELMESPYDVVRRAAREALAEFSFKRYLVTFEMLDDEVRRSTGLLVKRIDPHTVPLLRNELKSPLRTRRLRGLAIARAIEAVEALEPVVIQLLKDEDHMVRAEAASALGLVDSPASLAALQRALADSCEAVREAAQRSLP
jgi:HEAT repeat protein